MVWRPEDYRLVQERWRADPSSEWEPYWEFGAFVDVRDVATAVGLALTVPVEGHHRARADPWRALVDCSAAEATLGWRPAYGWPRG